MSRTKRTLFTFWYGSEPAQCSPPLYCQCTSYFQRRKQRQDMPPTHMAGETFEQAGLPGKIDSRSGFNAHVKRARKQPETPSERIPERRWKAIYRRQARSCSPTEKARIKKVGRSGLQCTDWKGAATEIEQRRQGAACAREIGEKENSPKKAIHYGFPSDRSQHCMEHREATTLLKPQQEEEKLRREGGEKQDRTPQGRGFMYDISTRLTSKSKLDLYAYEPHKICAQILMHSESF